MKYAVSIDRQASIILTFYVEAETAEAAEAVVQTAIDDNNISVLGASINERYTDEEESGWEIITSEEAA